MKLKLIQLCTNAIVKPEEDGGGMGITLNGLDENGQVWWYNSDEACWYPLSMDCSTPEKVKE